MSGKVYLVGAGPGDPELLTLKALRVLSAADVVLHDDLVSPDILAMVPADAEVVNVGKRAGGRHFPQEAIQAAMIAHAEAGKRVVRLKGGDPLVFGRAGEEMEALRAAGVRFEVVPGVTAALGAAAAGGFPLTDRRFASSLLFVSAHSCSGATAINWAAAIKTGATIVIYMPGDPGVIGESLLAAGLDPETPSAVITNASLTSEQVERRPLRRLGELSSAGSPKLLVIGTVVGMVEGQNVKVNAETGMETLLADAQLAVRWL